MNELTEETSATEEDLSSAMMKEVLGTDDFEGYIKSCYDALEKMVISSLKLPVEDEFKKFSRYKEFSAAIKCEQNRISEVVQMVLSYTGSSRKFKEHNDEDKTDLILDCNDILLDKSSHLMDILEGIVDPSTEPKAQIIVTPMGQSVNISGSWNKLTNSGSHSGGQGSKKALTATPGSVTLTVPKVTIRPQIYFKDKIDNRNIPWEPRIKEKPHAIKPLAILVETNDSNIECYSHPYEVELDRFTPAEDQLKTRPLVKPKELNETEFSYVDNEDKLNSMMADLADIKLLAVDLEHHSYRSFMGFTCLMQISTESKDYVIDTLSLRDKLYVLNEVFANPKVLKVFHGADSDIEWLQRDLNLYVVNMFDTYQASKVLEYPRLSLAYLMKLFCDIDAAKHFQLYDWRTRPLSEEAIKYAREDTHHLLYIYAQMSNQLLKKANGKTNLLESVYTRSTETCKRRYMKPIFDDLSYLSLYRKSKRLFDNRQMYALKEVFAWRDHVAREEDESTGYVLPNHMLVQMCEHLPREVQGVLACCNPIPPLVRQHVLEIHKIMLKAREQPLVKDLSESTETNYIVQDAGRTKSLGNLLLSSGEDWEFRDDLPTLLDGNLPEIEDPPEMKSSLGLYEDCDSFAKDSKRMLRKLNNMKNAQYLTPYVRYKLVLPYVQRMEEEEREAKEREYLELERKRKEMEKEAMAKLKLEGDVIKFNREGPVAASEPTLAEMNSKKRKSEVLDLKEEPDVLIETKVVKGEKGETSKKEGSPRKKKKMNPAANQPNFPKGGNQRPPIIGGHKILNLQINTTSNRDSNKGGNFQAFNYGNVNFNKFHSRNSNQQQQRNSSDNQSRHRGKRKNQPSNRGFNMSNKKSKW